VYDAVLDASYEWLFLVMELVDGVPLSAYLTLGRPLPVNWAVAVAAQVATVLSYAHDVPVIHRDLEPGTVLVDRDGTVKVLAFGIAAMLRTEVTKLTATGSPIGTHQYMSPEQVRGGRITPQTDLCALGCVLHELPRGRLVFEAGSEYLLMYQYVNAAPTPPRQLRPDVPEAPRSWSCICCARRPRRGPPTRRRCTRGCCRSSRRRARNPARRIRGRPARPTRRACSVARSRPAPASRPRRPAVRRSGADGRPPGSPRRRGEYVGVHQRNACRGLLDPPVEADACLGVLVDLHDPVGGLRARRHRLHSQQHVLRRSGGDVDRVRAVHEDVRAGQVSCRDQAGFLRPCCPASP
jgi:serine/threonine protein kinase